MKVSTFVGLACLSAALEVHAVAQTGSRSPERYRVVKDWPTLPDEVSFGEVSGLDVDSHGHVFVFHRAGRGWEPEAREPIAEPTVFQIDGETGALLRSWGDGAFLLPHGLTVDHNDNIWLTDVSLHQVFEFSHDGQLLLKLGSAREPGWDAAHFDRPTDVAVLSDGSFYVSDGYGNSRVAKFSSDGRFLYEWGKKGRGEGELDTPHGIAILSDGTVLVADRENSRIQVFDPGGQFVEMWSGAKNLGRVFAVSVGRDGSVYAGIRREDHVPESNGVLRLDGPGHWTELDRAGFSATGEAVFEAVHDLAVGPQGAIYVGETRTRRVVKLTPLLER